MAPSISEFNLLVSTPRRMESKGCAEIWFLLGEIGDRESTVEETGISGLIMAKTVLDPLKAIEGLRQLLEERPQEFRYTLKAVPIEVVTRTRLDEIEKEAVALSSKILEGETFRITVEKRHTELSARAIIEAIAKNIKRKVNLDNPDKIVLVDVLGGLTGISVVKPTDVLSVVKEKISSDA
jgi:tRNA acetyltransferase TAN1